MYHYKVQFIQNGAAYNFYVWTNTQADAIKFCRSDNPQGIIRSVTLDK
jgi:hypothetical protein